MTPNDTASALLPNNALAPILSVLVALVAAIESQSDHTSDAAIVAYRNDVRRQGEALAAAGGIDAMDSALAHVAGLDPARSREREAIINEAWTGLPDWHE